MTLKTITVVTPACMMCGKTSQVEMFETDYKKLVAGQHVQNVFPMWSPDERELLISGTHAECWDQMMAGLDEEDDSE